MIGFSKNEAHRYGIKIKSGRLLAQREETEARDAMTLKNEHGEWVAYQ